MLFKFTDDKNIPSGREVAFRFYRDCSESKSPRAWKIDHLFRLLIQESVGVDKKIQLACGLGYDQLGRRFFHQTEKVCFSLKHNGNGESHDLQLCINSLLTAGADPNLQDLSGLAPLHYAAIHNLQGHVTSLLNAGANPNLVNRNNNYTPLHYAARACRNQIIQLLIKKKADPNKETMNGIKCLSLAFEDLLTPKRMQKYFKNYPELSTKNLLFTVKNLVENGATMNNPSESLSNLISTDQKDTIEFLAKKGFFQNVQGFPVHYAVKLCKRDILILPRSATYFAA